MLKYYFGVWKPSLNGLAEKLIMGKLVLVNNTLERIVHSPSAPTSCLELVSQEIAADPEEHICYVNQDFTGPKSNRESYVVITSTEKEMELWAKYYFYNPEQVPGEARIRLGRLLVLEVPVPDNILKSYSEPTIAALEIILYSKYDKARDIKVISNLMAIARKH